MSIRARFIGIASILLILIVLLLIWQESEPDRAAFSCEDALGCVTVDPDDPVLIGSLQALTGGAAPIGEAQNRTIQLAIEDHGGELLGHPIRLHSEDTGCTQEGGANGALRLVADPQLVGVIGTACSGAASGALPIIAEAGLTMISGANTAPSLTSVSDEPGSEWQPGYFRAIYNGDQMMRAAARFVFKDLALRRVATVNDGDAFTRGFARRFEVAFVDLGGTITLSLTISKGDEEFGPALEALANSEPELIFIPIFQPEADYLVAQALAVPEVEGIPFLGVESLLVDDFITALNPTSRVYFVTATVLDTPVIQQLAERYQQRFGSYPNTTFRYAYDAMKMLLYAIEDVAIQESDGTLHIGRGALRERLYDLQDFVGITDTYTCTQYGDCSSTTFYLVQVTDPAQGLAGIFSNVMAIDEPVFP